MIVPNFVPEPLEIPGNVNTQPYDVRLRFIQRTNLFHTASLLGVGAVAYWGPQVDLLPSGLGFLAAMAALSLVRSAIRTYEREQTVSLLLLPAMLAAMGMFVRSLHAADLPVGWALAGPVASLVYTAAARRDFSFIGQFFLSWVGSSAAIGWAGANALTAWESGVALLANTVFLLYCVHDRSQVLYRRRPGEEWGATVDLYRDPLNFLGYSVRCIHHWRKHKIWTLPR